MADLTMDAAIRIKGEGKTERFFIDTSSAFTIYKGQPVVIDQNVDAVNVRGFVDGLTMTSTDVCVGIAAEGKTVVSGAAETTDVQVYTSPSIVGFKSAVYTNADLGATVYMSDSGTLSATPTANAQIGKLFKVEDGYCYVLLTAPQISASA